MFNLFSQFNKSIDNHIKRKESQHINYCGSEPKNYIKHIQFSSIYNYFAFIPQVFKTCKSTETFHIIPKQATMAVRINPPSIYIIFWLAKSSFNSLTFVIKELSRILVYSLAVLSSRPVARYSSYTFRVSIWDMIQISSVNDYLIKQIIIPIHNNSKAMNIKVLSIVFNASKVSINQDHPNLFANIGIASKVAATNIISTVKNIFKSFSIIFKSLVVTTESKEEFKLSTCALACWAGTPEATKLSKCFKVLMCSICQPSPKKDYFLNNIATKRPTINPEATIKHRRLSLMAINNSTLFSIFISQSSLLVKSVFSYLSRIPHLIYTCNNQSKECFNGS